MSFGEGEVWGVGRLGRYVIWGGRGLGIGEVWGRCVVWGGLQNATLVLTLILASCKKLSLDLSSEPPQAPGFKCKDS